MPEVPQTVYFHGIPGSLDELSLFGPEVAATTQRYHVADRSCAASDDASDHFNQMAKKLQTEFPDRGLHLVGFSLGAPAALKVADILGDQVEKIDLISAAAPLELDDYLGGMAGAPVFTLAQSHPRVFRLQCAAQSALAKLTPGLLFKLLFNSAAGADQELSHQAMFQDNMKRALKHSLHNNRCTYRHEIAHYVAEWVDVLDRVTQPTTIHHGEEDNWSPVAMAHDLAERLPNCTAKFTYPGMSHYSALRSYLLTAY